MFLKNSKIKQFFSFLVILTFINLLNAQCLFSEQKKPVQHKIQPSQTGITGILNDRNGIPAAGGLVIITNAMLDILYGETISFKKPIGKFKIIELPSTKELYVYAFHEEYPGMIDFQKIYLKNGQLKELTINVNQALLEPQQVENFFPNGREDFYKKINLLLAQSENKIVASRIIDQLDTTKRMTDSVPPIQQLNEQKKDVEDQKLVTESKSEVDSIETKGKDSVKKKNKFLLPILLGTALLTTVVLSLLVFKSSYSPNGIWDGQYNNQHENALSKFIFVGDSKFGTIELDGDEEEVLAYRSYNGFTNYSLNGKTISFTFVFERSSATFTGKFDSNDTMSGTWKNNDSQEYNLGRYGNWSIKRISSTTHKLKPQNK